MNIEVEDIALPVGTILQGRYEIEEIYYLGQFGIVYFGIDQKENRNIAIKEFMPYSVANRDMDGKSVVCKSPSYATQFKNAKEAFCRECAIVRALKDTKSPYEGCVLQYVEHFEENETLYLVTERIQGKSLQDYIENGEVFSIRNTMQMLVSVVRHIHKKKIVHCDIKPSNILLRDDGKVVLIDFGSACENKSSGEKVVCVSRGYSAPELYKKESIDFRADIYSIGAVLYYMLTDFQLPGPDEYEEQEEIPAISEFISIPAILEKMILRSLQRNKRKRPQSLFLLQIILNF